MSFSQNATMYEFPSYPPRPPQVPPWEFTGLSLLLAVILAVLLLRPRRLSQAIDPWYWLIPAAILGYGFTASIPGSTFAVAEWVTACIFMAVGFVATIIRMSPSARGRFWFSLVIVLFGGFAMRTVWADLAQVRTPELRNQCKNNLKQLGLAMHNYHDRYQAFPPPRQGEVSWRVRLLPYADNEALALNYDHNASWESQTYSEFARNPVFTCPRRFSLVQDDMWTYSDYAVPIGAGGLFETESTSPQFENVADGLSHTILVGEASGRWIKWNEPRDVNFDELPIGVNLPGSQPGWSDGVLSSYHSGGGQITFADGSTRILNLAIDPQVLKSLLIANDGGPENVEF